MNASRAVKQDFFAPADEPSFHRSRVAAAEAVLDEPDSVAVHEHVVEPMVRRAAGEMIRMDDEGIKTDIIEKGKPYDVLTAVSRRLTEMGATRQTAARIFRELEQYVSANGADFTRKFNAKPLYARVIVSDVKPEIPEECKFVSVTQINGERLLGDDASQVVLQYTVHGTRMSMSRQKSMETVLESGRQKDVWIIHGTIDSQDLNAFETADATMAALVEAVGAEAASSPGAADIRRAVEDGTLPVEMADLIETLAEISRVVEASRTPEGVENAEGKIAALKSDVMVLTDKISRFENVPPVIARAIVAAFDRTAMTPPAAVVSPQALSAAKAEIPMPVADNDNKISPVAPVPAQADVAENIAPASAIAATMDAPPAPVAAGGVPVVTAPAQIQPQAADIKAAGVAERKPAEVAPPRAPDAQPAEIKPVAVNVEAQKTSPIALAAAPAEGQKVVQGAETLAPVKAESGVTAAPAKPEAAQTVPAKQQGVSEIAQAAPARPQAAVETMQAAAPKVHIAETAQAAPAKQQVAPSIAVQDAPVHRNSPAMPVQDMPVRQQPLPDIAQAAPASQQVSTAAPQTVPARQQAENVQSAPAKQHGAVEAVQAVAAKQAVTAEATATAAKPQNIPAETPQAKTDATPVPANVSAAAPAQQIQSAAAPSGGQTPPARLPGDAAPPKPDIVAPAVKGESTAPVQARHAENAPAAGQAATVSAPASKAAGHDRIELPAQGARAQANAPQENAPPVRNAEKPTSPSSVGEARQATLTDTAGPAKAEIKGQGPSAQASVRVPNTQGAEKPANPLMATIEKVKNDDWSKKPVTISPVNKPIVLKDLRDGGENPKQTKTSFNNCAGCDKTRGCCSVQFNGISAETVKKFESLPETKKSFAAFKL